MIGMCGNVIFVRFRFVILSVWLNCRLKVSIDWLIAKYE